MGEDIEQATKINRIIDRRNIRKQTENSQITEHDNKSKRMN